LRADAGIVLTASHNPYEDNGIKFFRDDGYKLDDAIEKQIEDLFLAARSRRFARPLMPSARLCASMTRLPVCRVCEGGFPKG